MRRHGSKRTAFFDAVTALEAPSGNPKDKYGKRKVPLLSCVPPSAFVLLGLGFKDGVAKYGPYNWRKTQVRPSVFVDACMRHILAWWDGEELAGDSNVPHLAHALACLAIIADAQQCEAVLIDDRPPKGNASQLLERWMEKNTQEAPPCRPQAGTTKSASTAGTRGRTRRRSGMSRAQRFKLSEAAVMRARRKK